MSTRNALEQVTLATLTCGAAAAVLGLSWWPDHAGLYAQDDPAVVGAARGSDLVTLLVIAVGVWAVRHGGRVGDIVLAGVHAWLLFLHGGNALGAVAFNAAFPLYVAAMPLSGLGLLLAVQRLGDLSPPMRLDVGLAISGALLGLLWAFSLWREVAGGALPTPGSPAVRTTEALGLGVIVPAFFAAAWGIQDGSPWGVQFSVPLLGFGSLLLPMTAAQAIAQAHLGVVLGVETVVAVAGFATVSTIALAFLVRIARMEADPPR